MIPRRPLLNTVWKGTRSVFIAGSNNTAIAPYAHEDASSPDVVVQAADASHGPDCESHPAASTLLPAIAFPGPRGRPEESHRPVRRGFDGIALNENTRGSGISESAVPPSPKIERQSSSSLARPHGSIEISSSTGKERAILPAQLVTPHKFANGGLEPTSCECIDPKLQRGLGFSHLETSGAGVESGPFRSGRQGGVVQNEAGWSGVVDDGAPSSGLSSLHAACQGTGSNGDVHRVRSQPGLPPAPKHFPGLPRTTGSFMEAPVSSRQHLEARLADQVGSPAAHLFSSGARRPPIAVPDARGLQLLSLDEEQCSAPAATPPLLHGLRAPMPMPAMPLMHMPMPYPMPHGMPLNQRRPSASPLWTPAATSGAPGWQGTAPHTGDGRHGAHEDTRWPLPGSGLICYLPQPGGFEMHGARADNSSHLLGTAQSRHGFFPNASAGMVGAGGPQINMPPPSVRNSLLYGAHVGSQGTPTHESVGPWVQGVESNLGSPIGLPVREGGFEGSRGLGLAVHEGTAELGQLTGLRPLHVPLLEGTETHGGSIPPRSFGRATVPKIVEAAKNGSKNIRSSSKGLRKEVDNTRLVDVICDVLKKAATTGEVTAERIGELVKLRRPIKSFEICQVLKTVEELPVALAFFEWCKQQRWYKPDVFVYTTVIGLAGEVRDGRLMQSLYEEMLANGLEPTHVTLNRLLYGYGRAGLLSKATEAFQELESRFGGADSVSFHTMIDIYSKAGQIRKAEDTFRKMQERGFPPTVVAFGQLLCMYSAAEEMVKAERCFRKIKEAGLVPNEVTYNIMINLYGKVGRPDLVIVMVDQMLNAGLNPDILTYTTLMNQFGKQGRVADAERIFNLMLARRNKNENADNVAFTTMMDIYMKEGETENALRCFRTMLDLGVRPHNVTYNVLLNLFIRRHDFDGMCQVFDTMVKLKLTPCLPTYTMLLSTCTPNTPREGSNAIMSLMPMAHPGAHSLLQALLASPELPASRGGPGSSFLSLPSSSNMPTFAKDLMASPGTLPSHASCSTAVRAYSGPFTDGSGVRDFSAMIGDVVAKQNLDHLRGFFDAVVNFLCLCGRPALGSAIWAEAEARQVYPFFLNLNPNIWRVDLHSMSTQTAVVALLSALRGFQRSFVTGQPTPSRVVVVTGWGKRSRVHGESTVKQTVQDLLAVLGSPLTVDMENAGIQVGDGVAVKEWLLLPQTSEMLVLKDPK